jgi:hypothetical protein
MDRFSRTRRPVAEAVEGRSMGAEQSKESKPESGSDIDSPPASDDEPGDRGSDADQAKENERQAEEEGRELPA